MTDNKTIESLKQGNIYSSAFNNYFCGTVNPKLNSYVAFGIFATLNVRFVIINHTQDGIYIIPVDPANNKMLTKDNIFIGNDEIEKIVIEKRMLGLTYDIEIIANNKKTIKMQVHKSVLTVKGQKDNVQKFITKYGLSK